MGRDDLCFLRLFTPLQIETLDLTRYNSSGPLLLLYFLLVIFCADLFSVLASSILGGIPLRLNRNKTVKGISVGSALAMLVGVALFWLTPFNLWQTAIFSLAIVLSGCMGDLVISAVKRSLGSVATKVSFIGRGILERFAPLTFAAPVCYHLTVLFFTYFHI